jgi:4-hydroxy-tetrahydrodipicolinate reductase
MIDVLVSGAAGKMGSLSATTIAAEHDLRVVALVDPRQGADAGGAPRFASVEEALAVVTPAAALEFSVPSAVFANAVALLEAGVATVVGTTGLSDAQVAELGAIAAAHDTGLLIVPNFALGAVLLMEFARLAARHFPQAEIIEMHGAAKIDAPSGTSLRTARMMSLAAGEATPSDGPSSPARGFLADQVRIHSVRLPGLVAHQEVLFGGDDEVLTLRHDSLSRRSFMSGVLLAMRRVTGIKGTVIGLENLLN